MCFLSFSEGIIGFKAYDTLQLCFCRIPNWGDWDHTFEAIFFEYQTGTIADQFLEGLVTLVKLIIFLSWIFSAIDQILLQRFTARVLRFRAYDTRYLHFCQISNWRDCRSLFWSRDVTLLKILIFVK